MNTSAGGCITTAPYDSRIHLKGLYIACEVVIAVLAIVGNVLVCVAVTWNKKLRTVTNYFLISLAVADILVGLVAIPCAVLTDLGRPRYNLPLCLLLLTILIVLTQSSILSLLAVAAERYMAILLPFQYQRIMSPRNARLALFITWSLGVVSGSVPLMDWQKQKADYEYCLFSCVVDMTYMVYFNFFCGLLLPLVAMFVIYAHIFVTVRRQLRRITICREAAEVRSTSVSRTTGTGIENSVTQGSAAGRTTGRGSGTEVAGVTEKATAETDAESGVGSLIETDTTTVFTKANIRSSSPTQCLSAPPNEGKSGTRVLHEARKATSLFMVLFLFMVCWMPIHCINCITLLCPQCDVPMSLTLAAILLSHANSALNPLLYAYRMKSFRRTLTGMCYQSSRLNQQ
ncbi:adenosine receptor A1-like [Thalassophryne amazonica]|uniref:adenosine receptor A1-like n=1 Tax=Thalassophryne amazonica TaxID=390379 RepID=UPI0014715EA8|nr:adenosine receptor A1-like [Thalassophryne amazonica]